MLEDAGFPGEALEEVGRAAGARNAMALLTMLEHPAFEVRVAAIAALGEVGAEQAKLALVGIARDRYGQRPEVRIAALRALGKLYPSGRYASFLEDFIAGDSRKVMVVARKLLAEADPEGFPARLVRRGCLDHAAIKVYGRAREASAVPLLADFLEERERMGDLASGAYWGKVYAAARALGCIGGDGAEGALQTLAQRSGEGGSSPDGFLRNERLEKIADAARQAMERLESDTQ